MYVIEVIYMYVYTQTFMLPGQIQASWSNSCFLVKFMLLGQIHASWSNSCFLVKLCALVIWRMRKSGFEIAQVSSASVKWISGSSKLSFWACKTENSNRRIWVSEFVKLNFQTDKIEVSNKLEYWNRQNWNLKIWILSTLLFRWQSVVLIMFYDFAGRDATLVQVCLSVFCFPTYACVHECT